MVSGVANITHYNPNKYPETWKYEFEDSTVIIRFKDGLVEDIMTYDSKGILKY